MLYQDIVDSLREKLWKGRDLTPDDWKFIRDNDLDHPDPDSTKEGQA